MFKNNQISLNKSIFLSNQININFKQTIMKQINLFTKFRFAALIALIMFFSSGLKAQTNVYDDVIAESPDHTYLLAAINQLGIESVLQDDMASLTVFAPTNTAFDNLAAELGTDISGLLELPELSDIVLYHVLEVSVAADDVNLGDIVTPANDANTLKLTKTADGMVYINQAMVETADLTTDNGIVHSIDAVLLPSETVVDIAIDNGFTTLTTAVVTAELLPALTNPFATYTVFAPSNEAFDNLVAALDISLEDLLALPDLADILLYHALGSEAMAADINNGDLVTPLNDANTIKLTKTSEGMVYANQAMVTLADVMADNGVVHAIDAVILPAETVADVAIDNGFTTLTTAVVTAELLPALTDPFATYTVFAPSNKAFVNLVTALGISLEDLLALPDLGDILLYHALGSEAMAADINNGDLVTPLNDANTIKLTKTSEGMVYANQAMVTLADVMADNGVVHAIDAVILPAETVADVAIDNEFTTLTTAVVTAELLPALTDPFATYTVFAPSNEAFDNLVAALGITLEDLLALPDLGDILLYHALGSEAMAADINNGDLVTPLNNANTIKLTKTSEGMVYANQAMVTLADVMADNGVVHAIDAVILPAETVADIAIDNEFTTLTTAVVAAELLPALTDPLASYTVFAPSNEAFDNLVAALGISLEDLLAVPDLADILLYHALGSEALAADINNGDLVTPLNDANTIKLTKTTDGMVYANQAMVTLADVMADNGVVHAIDAVILPAETVADVAIDNEFTTLTTAVVAAELLPALTDPLASYTVFAPSNEAFDNLVAALGISLEDLLALPDLADILLYHALGSEAFAADINNGDLVTPLNDANTIKLTKTSEGMVYANQAMVTLADVMADNGVVHAIDAVILPAETVADVAIDNGFTSLTTAVITAELLPALTDPLAKYTVFAPDNTAFDDLAEALGTDLEGILALPNLADILLYHVAGSELFSTDLENGPVTMLNGEDVTVSIEGGVVMINTSEVTLADVASENGVVHVIDEVLIPSGTVGIDQIDEASFEVFPNPSTDYIMVRAQDDALNEIALISIDGKVVFQQQINANESKIDVSNLDAGKYILRINSNASVITKSVMVY